MNKVKIRPVKAEDAAELLKIYAPYIVNSATSFETAVPSEAEFLQRIQRTAIEYPYMVCEINDEIAGYAYSSRHYTRAAYRWNAEISVYILKKFQGNGIGRAFYGLIEQLLLLQNVKNMMAIITIPNEPSIQLAAYCGFSRIAVWPKAGFKAGAWHDVVQMEKEISPRIGIPEEFIEFTKINKADQLEVLKKWEESIKV